MSAASMKPLNENDQARVAALREQVLAEIPEAVPLLRALHQEGLIEGWRAVTYVGPPRAIAGAVPGPHLPGTLRLPKE